MYFSTTSNPENKTPLSLIIVQRDEEKILTSIEKPGRCNVAYEDMVKFVESRWGLPGFGLRLAFETCELPVVPGQMVEIDHSAWDGIVGQLGRIYVVTKPLREVAPTATQISVDRRDELRVESEITEAHHDEEPQEDDEDDDDEADEQTEYDHEEGHKIMSRPESNKSDYVVVTPTETHASSPPALSLKGLPKVPSTSEPQNESVKPPNDPLNLFNDILVGGSTSRINLKEATAQKANPIESHPPNLSNTLSFSENSSRVDLKNTPQDRSGFVTPASVTSTVGPDDQVLVYVDAPSIDRSAAFRVRCKHPLEKVLKGACRNFKVSQDSASFFMAVPDEDGEDRLIRCSLSSTVQSLGISDEQRFVITFD